MTKEVERLSSHLAPIGVRRTLKTSNTDERVIVVKQLADGVLLTIDWEPPSQGDVDRRDVLTPAEARHVAQLLNSAADAAERGGR